MSFTTGLLVSRAEHRRAARDRPAPGEATSGENESEEHPGWFYWLNCVSALTYVEQVKSITLNLTAM